MREEREGLINVINTILAGTSELKGVNPDMKESLSWIENGLSIVRRRVDELYQLAQKEDYGKVIALIEGESDYHPLRRLGEEW